MKIMKFLTQTNTNKEQLNKIKTAKQLISNFVNNNNFRIKGNLDILSNINNSHIDDLSKNKYKRIAKHIRWVEKKTSISAINKFLHFMGVEVLQSNDRVKILISEKEEAIQAKRKLWVEARDKAEILLNEYKKEKGNFYKK